MDVGVLQVHSRAARRCSTVETQRNLRVEASEKLRFLRSGAVSGSVNLPQLKRPPRRVMSQINGLVAAPGLDVAHLYLDRGVGVPDGGCQRSGGCRTAAALSAGRRGGSEFVVGPEGACAMPRHQGERVCV